MRRLIHENLLPALDRLSVLLSRLRGLSRFQALDISLGLDTQELDKMVDTINSLQLVSHHMLICAGSELQGFTAFSAWLGHEIEKQATDPSSASAQEIAEKDMSLDHISVLEYVQGAMENSQLSRYLDPTEGQIPEWNLEVQGRPLFELYKNEFQISKGSLQSSRKLPGIQALTHHFQKQCDSLFQRIAEVQRRNVRFGTPLHIGMDTPDRKDMRIVDGVRISESFINGFANKQHYQESPAADEFMLYVALGPTKQRTNGWFSPRVYSVS